jgi:hypothetical protein
MKRYKENISDKEFLGEEFLQNCGDILKVLEKTSQKTKSGIRLFRCQFQKYPHEVFAPKANILSGSVLNPFIEENEFLNKEYKQNCGDIIIPLEKSNQKQCEGDKSSGYLYKCKFLEYPCEILASKAAIKRGEVNNPQIELYTFIGKRFKQNCGDILTVIKKTDILAEDKTHYLFEVLFDKYNYKTLALKTLILRGNVDNPFIEKNEFLNKEWIQKSGDILIPLEKVYQKERYYFKCFCKKYKNIIFAEKKNILEGTVPENEIIKDENEFLNKEYKQNCGDILIPKERIKNEKGITYYICNFIGKYSCKIFAKKYHILRGGVGNPKNPNYYTSLEFWLKQYIKKLGFESKNLWLGNKEIDVYIPSLKIGFEINGIYWHSNEFKDKNYHLNKLKEANKNGIKLYFIWEDEIWNSEKKIKSFIKDIILIGKSELYPKEVDKIGIWDSSFSEPQLIKRGCFECWNCGFILK